MSKQDDKQKPPFIFYFIILAFIILVALNFAGDYNLREQPDNPQVQANQDNIDFLIQRTNLTQTAMINLIDGLQFQTLELAELKSYDETISSQIGTIRSDIKSKFPQASNVETTEQTSISSTPFLTLKMDQREFFLGNTIIFMGTAQPNNPIFLTLKDPTRELWQIPISKTEIINGAYIANYTLRLDDPIGTWTVYARQVSDTTKTLSFKVE